MIFQTIEELIRGFVLLEAISISVTKRKSGPYRQVKLDVNLIDQFWNTLIYCSKALPRNPPLHPFPFRLWS